MRRVAALLTVLALALPSVAAEGDLDFRRAAVGEVHPDVRLPNLNGEGSLRLSDLRGQKVLLIEFASW